MNGSGSFELDVWGNRRAVLVLVVLLQDQPVGSVGPYLLLESRMLVL